MAAAHAERVVESVRAGELRRRRDAEDARRTRHVVADAVDIPPGSMKLFDLGEFGVGIYNIRGRFYALNNFCPHEGAQVCLGGIRSSAEFDEERRQYVETMHDQVLRCPWHQWEFDITTGKSLVKPERRVKTYRVDVENGKVVLTL